MARMTANPTERPERYFIRADTTELTAAIAELKAALKISPKIVNVLRELVGDDAGRLVKLEGRTTAGAGVTALFKPSDCLLDFLAAFRAGKFQQTAIDN